MTGIRKSFPGVIANDDISFSIHSGEVVGLLGENGAGKSTLMNILYGLIQPDEGEIRLNQSPVNFASPRDARRHGIGMVHQHFMLIPTHTVAENIALSLDDAPFFDPVSVINDRLDVCSRAYGIHVDPKAFVWQLSAGERQRIEIVKALLGNARLLLLDEPTSVMTPDEINEFIGVLRAMTAAGIGIVFITHKLEEILSVASRITVLRKGRLAGTVRPASKDTNRSGDTAVHDGKNMETSSGHDEVDKAALARLMVGRELEQIIPGKSPPEDDILFEVENLTVMDDRGRTAVKNVGFTIRRGEILGVAGVSGNGQRELIESLAGMRSPESGTARLADRVLPLDAGARAIFESGVAHIPEERMRFGTVANMSIQENIILKAGHRAPFSRRGIISFSAAANRTTEIVNEYRVAATSIVAPMKNLSGGNIQKVIVGRELADHPALVLAAHPTYGVDIGAAEGIRSHLRECRDAGGAVFLVSEELEELFELADRIAVMESGRIVGIVDPRTSSFGEVGMMMAGAHIPGRAISSGDKP
ncbi:MAG: ABC transporter ATP-binding protein [Candidatus Riflebacteria bacterium]|nr:ABC transporter ATP-binding protein [Candidatus Riflebacteria bacterium]